MGFMTDSGLMYLWKTYIVPALKGKQDTLTFDSTPTAGSSNPVTSDGVKAAIDAAGENVASTCFFYVPFKLGSYGFELDGVTYTDILTAYQAGKRIVGKAYVPAQANLGFVGSFDLAMTYLSKANEFVLAFISGPMSVEVFVTSNNSVLIEIKELQNISGRVSSISSKSTDSEYPSAKAVYDYIESRLNGLTLKPADSAPTTDDRSVITFVDEG